MLIRVLNELLAFRNVSILPFIIFSCASSGEAYPYFLYCIMSLSLIYKVSKEYADILFFVFLINFSSSGVNSILFLFELLNGYIIVLFYGEYI